MALIPTVLVPGLLCTPDLYAPQFSLLRSFGPVTVADHRHDETMEAVTQRILKDAPARFALLGLSMGGYVCLAIMRLEKSEAVSRALVEWVR